MRRLDLPPLWCAGFALLIWLWSGIDPVPAPGWLRAAGWVALAGSAGLILWAIVTMARAETPIEPHRDPRALVTGGPFGWVRHPIYRGFWVGLGGFALAVGAPLGLLLVPVYARLLTRRFVEPEERRLEAAFGDAFREWAARTPRRL